jgi:hypothetical protein
MTNAQPFWGGWASIRRPFAFRSLKGAFAVRYYTRPAFRVKPYRVTSRRPLPFGYGIDPSEETLDECVARLRRERLAEEDRLLAKYRPCPDDSDDDCEPDRFAELEASWQDQFDGTEPVCLWCGGPVDVRDPRGMCDRCDDSVTRGEIASLNHRAMGQHRVF